MDRTEAVAKIGKSWDQFSACFDEVHDTEDIAAWKETLKELLGQDTRKNVLDLGTGTGFLANMTGELGYPTVGVDVSREMMKYGVRHGYRRNSGVTYMYGDVLELPMLDESVDNIINARLIWTLVEPEAALQEWFRVLRAGGKLFCFNRMQEGVGLIRYTETPFYGSQEIDDMLTIQAASMEELTSLLERAGFVNIEIRKLSGLTRPEYEYDPWFVLCGEKPKTTRDITSEAMSCYWDKRAESYEPDHALMNSQAWDEAVRKLLGHNMEQSILDIAAGTGMLTIMMGKAGYKNVCGGDISEGMMHIAIRHAKEENLDIPFIYANALKLPYEDNSLDTVISMRLLWTLAEPETAIREWLRVLKPGGRIIAINELEEFGVPDFIGEKGCYIGEEIPVAQFGFSNASKMEILETFKKAGAENAELIHMDGCCSKEYARENWYAFAGTKSR